MEQGLGGGVVADATQGPRSGLGYLIIDGYNLIRQWPELAMLDRADLQSGREALLQELRAYQREKRHRITVVFDGRERGGVSGGAENAGGIGVRYSRQGETADEVIAHLVAEAGMGLQPAAARQVDGTRRDVVDRGAAVVLDRRGLLARLHGANARLGNARFRRRIGARVLRLPIRRLAGLAGSGVNMWSTNDQFQFAWKKMNGDFIVRARVEFVGKAVAWPAAAAAVF